MAYDRISDAYKRGYDEGYAQGRGTGREEGYEEGRKEALWVARREDEEARRELVRRILNDE